MICPMGNTMPMGFQLELLFTFNTEMSVISEAEKTLHTSQPKYFINWPYKTTDAGYKYRPSINLKGML